MAPTSHLKSAYSKALEFGCLSRFFLSPFDYDTVSGGEGDIWSVGKEW